MSLSPVLAELSLVSAELSPIVSPELSPVLVELSPVVSPEETSPHASDNEDSDNEDVGCQATSPITVDELYLCGSCGEKYSQPTVLPCLHVFCLSCLEKMCFDDERGQTRDSVQCPTCHQECVLPMKGASDLVQDYVMGNMLDMAAIEKMEIACTSCKAQENAIARCSDCPNFLGPNCVTAHQYMRCFENHRVVTFEEIQAGGEEVAIHKPIFCSTHSAEIMKFYCNTCQIPVCNECLVTQHKQHVTERVSELYTGAVGELKNLVLEAKSKVGHCEEATSSLEGALTDLQLQRDSAKSSIQETFQTYKVTLEKCQERLLQELEEIHHNQELGVMEMSHNIEKTIEKIEDGCKFTERVIEQGNGIEVMTMRKTIVCQLLSLINNTPKPEVSINMNFVSDPDKFEKAVRESFGHFQKEEAKSDTRPSSSLQSSFENEGFAIPSNMLSPNSVSMATSAAEFIPSFASSSLANTLAQNISCIASSMTDMPLVRSLSRNSQSPAMSDSGISDIGGATSGSSTPLVSLQALGKLGHVSVNAQGQIILNGQVIPGLNVNNVSGIPASLTTQGEGLPRARSHTPNSWDNTDQGSMLGDSTSSHGMAILGGRSNSTSGWGDATSSALGRSLSTSGWGDPPDGLLGASSNSQDGLSLLSSGSSSNTWDNSTFTNNPALNPALNNIGTFSAPSTPGTPVHGGPFCGTPGSGFSSSNPPFPVRGAGKMSAMQIRCKFGQLGPGKGQFNSPHGFCLGSDEDIVVADTNNHRIQVFEKTGEFKYQFGIPGREEGQLWYPRKVAVMRSSGKFVVCDRGNERSRMQIFSKNGHFIKKIAIRYIDIVAGLCITTEGHIVAVDSVSPTIFRISETGELLCWFDCSEFMREPSDVAMCDKEYYVCDFKGHCVVIVNQDGEFIRRIGCENITNFPNGIDVSDAGDVLVGDSHGNRFHVAVFKRDGSLGGEYECPYVKVSRCCGLKLSSEGYVVTLAKNNHHVLVLNTLYIT